MTIYAPRTSAEIAMEAYALTRHAAKHGRNPTRMPGYAGALLIEGPLPPSHPLADSPAEIRAKRVEQERRRRGL